MKTTLAFAALLSVLLIAQALPLALADTPASAEPDIGDVMLGIQQHHAKMALAGLAGNWDLADYELGEIRESFETAGKLHPKFKAITVNLAELIPVMTDAALKDVGEAIKGASKPRFKASVARLSEACTRCHQATEHPFIVIKAPQDLRAAAMAFPNQDFAPRHQ